MASRWDEDEFEGDFGGRRAPSRPDRTTFPEVSGSGSNKRARAAWFNRPRGAGQVKLATPRDPASQRVIVKLKSVVHAQVRGGAGGLMRHALYVEREGADRAGDKVQVFDRELDRADGAAFAERCEGDRHHFRVIISPEHGDQLGDLKTFTRELMDRVADDLRVRIDWIAAAHHDTGRAHVHLFMRGRRDDGRQLVIPREYIAYGFRQRAEEIATRELGLRLDRGLGQVLERVSDRTIELERFTKLDRALIDRARDGEIGVADLAAEPRSQAILVRRLNRLEDMQLAARSAPNSWRLAADLEDNLTRRSDARDRARATARLLANEDRGLAPERTRELEQAHTNHRVIGRLIGFEQMSGDVRGAQLIGVEGVDGRFWTARVARREELRALNGVERGAVVALARAKPGLKPADRTILEIADADRQYSAERHRSAAPSDREIYIQMHVRRLEALRTIGIVERDAKGVFHLPADYEAQVLKREGRGGRESAQVTLLDPNPLKKQARHHGPTWLDRVAGGREDNSQLAEDGFGEDVRAAWKLREETLKALRLGYDTPNGFVTVADAEERLSTLERDDLRQRIERETGLVAHFARDGDRVEGVFVSRIHTQERSYALVAHESTATLAPWRPEMDRALNQFVSGQVKGRQFEFTCGRGAEKNIVRGLDSAW